MAKEVVALSLFSGGLDSILATRVIAAQGIKVIAIKFVSPFFDYSVLEDQQKYIDEAKEKYGIDVLIKDISNEYVQLLHNPAHGFGKNFNPCIDCKIFMFRKARQMMDEMGASFLITGEVLGQRPMSQRRDTLNVIERDSGNKTYLLRPLSAKMMNPTEAELQGLVDREQLLNFSGRGRSRQIALAKEFGISEFPAPAGGCRLADPILSKRISKIYSGDFAIRPEDISINDILCLMTGRQFILPGGSWLMLGRDEKDNESLRKLRNSKDILLCTKVHPGPTALLRFPIGADPENEFKADIDLGRSLVVQYSKKVNGKVEPQVVETHTGGRIDTRLTQPVNEEDYHMWMV